MKARCEDRLLPPGDRIGPPPSGNLGSKGMGTVPGYWLMHFPRQADYLLEIVLIQICRISDSFLCPLEVVLMS